MFIDPENVEPLCATVPVMVEGTGDMDEVVVKDQLPAMLTGGVSVLVPVHVPASLFMPHPAGSA
jgi:hypothetical protein